MPSAEGQQQHSHLVLFPRKGLVQRLLCRVCGDPDNFLIAVHCGSHLHKVTSVFKIAAADPSIVSISSYH